MAPYGSHGAVVEVQNCLLEFGLSFGSDLATALEGSTLGLETAKRQTGQTSRPRFREACNCKNENDAIAKLETSKARENTTLKKTQLRLQRRMAHLHAWTFDYVQHVWRGSVTCCPQHLRRQEGGESCVTALKNEVNCLLRRVIQAACVFDASVDALDRGACL